MGKNPAYQWYTGDWQRDTQVQMSCMTTRGVWREMLDRMWDAPERGRLTGTKEQIQKLIGCTDQEWEIFFCEFQKLNIGGVTFRDNEMTLTNRRMFREEKIRKDHVIRQERYRKKNSPIYNDGKNNKKVTPSSSSSSSSSKKEGDFPFVENVENPLQNHEEKFQDLVNSLSKGKEIPHPKQSRSDRLQELNEQKKIVTQEKI